MDVIVRRENIGHPRKRLTGQTIRRSKSISERNGDLTVIQRTRCSAVRYSLVVGSVHIEWTHDGVQCLVVDSLNYDS